jgi:hypothetical protein
VRVVAGRVLREEIIAVAHRLDEDERAVERERGESRKRELRRRPHRARHRDRVVGQHERQHRKRGQHGERRARAFELKRLHAVPQAAQQQTQADDAVAHDHDRGEHRVSRERRLRVASREHHGYDQRDLDHRDGDRERERTERLTDPMRDDFGVVDGGEDDAGQARGDDHEERRGTRGKRHGGERRPRNDRREPCPVRGQRAALRHATPR